MAHNSLHGSKHGPVHGARHGVLTLGGGLIPSLIAAGTAMTGTGALDMVGKMPTAGANDVEILAVVNTHSTITAATLSTAAGFAAIAGAEKDSGSYVGLHGYLTLFWRRGGGSAPVVADNGEFNVAQAYSFADCLAAGDPWEAVATTGDNDGDTAFSVAGTTTTGPNRLGLVFSGGFLGGSQTVDSLANADLSSFTAVANTSHNVSGDFVYLGLCSGGKAAAGAFGATTGTWNAGAYRVYAGISLALKPTV